MNAFVALFFGGLGAIVGSFLNVVIYRLPRGRSLGATGRSQCPKCGHLIAWYDNVPILSYLVLLGRCRSCRARISPRYPFVEALTAAIFAGSFLRSGPLAWEPRLVGAASAALFGTAALAFAFIQAEHGTVSANRKVLVAALIPVLVGVLAVPAMHGTSLVEFDLAGVTKPRAASLAVGLIGALALGIIVYAQRWIGAPVEHGGLYLPEDTAFAAVCGLLLGPVPGLLAMLTAVLAGLVFYFARRRPTGLAPFLAPAAMGWLLLGSP